ncbi:ParA family protein [Haloplanus halobius]|uniref:ParA family protein n=1 Tax=Haloplanus halobius TaxID=2934938 RepID=UPI00200CDCBA|nr:ParA family protein [Haloplanus sp. XH21]
MTDDIGDVAALVGATGGAGTTRLTVELGALLASDGRAVAILDAAFATQGLSDYLSGRIDPDLTALLTDEREAPLQEGLLEFPLDTDAGRMACLPAFAPFERLARAKSPAAAQVFESRIDAAAAAFDHVLVDTPPVAANQSVAAVNAADRIALVAPATTHGRDAVQRMDGRLADIGVEADAVVSTRGELSVADATLPETDIDAPACLSEQPTASATADVAAAVFDIALSPEETGLFGSIGEFVSR